MSTTSLLPNHNHFISLSAARTMKTLYLAEKENILDSAYRQQGILSTSETFNREPFDTVLALEGCVGLRVYFGMEESYKVKVIIVGVNEDNSDILPEEESLLENEEEKIIEIGRPCPDFCAVEPHL